MLVAVRAMLLHFEPVGVVTPVLASHVVAVLAVHASHGDLWTDITAGHWSAPFLSECIDSSRALSAPS